MKVCEAFGEDISEFRVPRHCGIARANDTEFGLGGSVGPILQ
jgi:hypothetical protein